MTQNFSSNSPSRIRAKTPKSSKTISGRPASDQSNAALLEQEQNKVPRSKVNIDKFNYYERKRVILGYEKKNYTKLFFVRSDGEDGWFKAFGNSALIFASEIAPKIGSRARVHPDLDQTVNSKIGFVAMKNLESLEGKLEKLGVKVVEKTEMRWVFELGYRVDPETMVVLREQNMSATERANKIILPQIVMSTLYGDLRELYNFIFWLVRRMEPPTRDMIGYAMEKRASDMLERYVLEARGKGDAEGFLKFVLERVEDVNASYVKLDATRVVDADKMLTLAEYIEKVRKQAIYEMKVARAKSVEAGRNIN